MTKKESIEFNAKIVPEKPLNDEFTLCKCYVLALGKNRNRSHLSKEAVEDAVPTIYNIPVVGHMYVDENGDYHMGGHDTAIVRDENNKLVLKSVCIPVGVVPADSNIHFENIIDSKGSEVTYQVADVILWTGRYPDIHKAIYSDDIWFGQSMEIDVKAYEPLKDDANYSDITKYSYSALCLLGKSDDAEFHVEPCFPDSRVEPYNFSLDTDEFKQLTTEFKEKLSECFQAIKSEKGGKEELTDEVYSSVLAEYGLAKEDITFETDNMTEEEFREKLDAEFKGADNFDEEPAANNEPEPSASEQEPEKSTEPEVANENVSENPGEEPQPAEQPNEEENNADMAQEPENPEDADAEPQKENFSKASMTYIQKLNQISEAAQTLCEEDYENMKFICYYVNDCDDNYAYLTECKYEDGKSETRNCRVKYEIGEDEKVKFVGEFEDIRTRYLTDEEVDNLEKLRAEYTELKAFQSERLENDRINEYDAVISEFSDLANFEEFSSLVENKMAFESADALREKCYAIRGKFAAVPTVKKPESKLPLDFSNKEKTEPYNGFFSKYPPKRVAK